jgi:hypothetical protein
MMPHSARISTSGRAAAMRKKGTSPPSFPGLRDPATTEALSSVTTLFATAILRGAERRSTTPAQAPPISEAVYCWAPDSADTSVMEIQFQKEVCRAKLFARRFSAPRGAGA